MISIMALVPVISICFLVLKAAAQWESSAGQIQNYASASHAGCSSRSGSGKRSCEWLSA